MDHLAKGQMTSYLKDKSYDAVIHSHSTKQTCDLLCKHYKGKGKHQIIGVIKGIFYTKLSDLEPLKPQLNKFVSQMLLVNQFKNQVVFDNEFITIAILNSMPLSQLPSLTPCLYHNHHPQLHA